MNWENKLSFFLFPDYMIVYVEKSVEYTPQKTSVTISEFNKFVKCRVNILYLLYFYMLAVNNWKFKFKTKHLQ